jgi:hypothetical protein
MNTNNHECLGSERGVSLLCETEKYGSGSLGIKGVLGSVPYWTYIIQ